MSFDEAKKAIAKKYDYEDFGSMVKHFYKINEPTHAHDVVYEASWLVIKSYKTPPSLNEIIDIVSMIENNKKLDDIGSFGWLQSIKTDIVFRAALLFGEVKAKIANSVKQEAAAKAWDEGFDKGWEEGTHYRNMLYDQSPVNNSEELKQLNPYKQ